MSARIASLSRFVNLPRWGASVVMSLAVWLGWWCPSASAQLDPYARNLVQLGYDQPLVGQGPQAAYAYYYLNDPEFVRTNMVLRMAIAPAYMDGELGFKGLLSPYTDLGIGINGGAFGDNFYEVRRGNYVKAESFDGYGGGSSLSIYQLLNPGQNIPLHLVAQSGFHYSTYAPTHDTSHQFELPENRVDTFVKTGLRFAGKEPLLYPELAMEVSVWFERLWRSSHRPYGFAGDRDLSPVTDLYWAYAGLNYTWTNIGHQFTFGVTAGGSHDTDRFSAWRLGGVLPLVAEFPLTLPGYYYEEISAKRFVHLSGAYAIPLDRSHQWQMRFEAASAYVDYLDLPGYDQSNHWNTGAGTGLEYTSRSKFWRVILRYGYGFNALRHGGEGAHSIGLLCQFDFEKLKHRD